MGQILIIDHEIASAHALTQALKQHGMEPTLMANGNDGFAWAREHRPDAIVLCVELMGVSGYAICNRLKKDDALAHIPLVLASSEATSDVFDEHRRLRTRADGYVFKPYDIAAVLNELDAAKASASLRPFGAQTQSRAEEPKAAPQEHVEARDAVPTPAASAQAAGGDDAADGEADAEHDPLMSTDALLLLEGAVDVNTHTQVIRLPLSVRDEQTKDLIGAALADIDERQSPLLAALDERVNTLENTVRTLVSALADSQALISQLTGALARLEARQQQLHQHLGAALQQSLKVCLGALGQDGPPSSSPGA